MSWRTDMTAYSDVVGYRSWTLVSVFAGRLVHARYVARYPSIAAERSVLPTPLPSTCEILYVQTLYKYIRVTAPP